MDPALLPQSAHLQAPPAFALRRRVGLAIGVLGALFIASETLVPHPELESRVLETPWWCVLCGEMFGVDCLLNLLLFVPFGLGLRLAGWSRRRAQLTACAVTLCVESAQVSWVSGRDASLGDLITNSLGAALGIALADQWPKLVFPGRIASRRWAAGSAALWVILWACSGWLVQPDLPRSTWFSLVKPRDVYLEDFAGKVLSARANALPLVNGPLPDLESFQDRAQREGLQLEASAVTGAASQSFASIVSVVDERRREIFALGQEQRDLVFHVRSRVARVGLRQPAIRLAGCVPAAGGSAWQVSAGFRNGHMFVQSSAAEGVAATDLGLSPSWGWSFFLPYDYSFGPEVHALTALWIAGLLVPIGYWARRAQLPDAAAWRAAALPGAAALIGLAVIPRLLQLPAVHGSEWLAALAGTVCGVTLGSATTLRAPASG